jgi:hypothetical protein
MDRTTTTDVEQLGHVSAEYLKAHAALWEYYERVADALREDVEAGRLTVEQADVLLATIILDDDHDEDEDEDEDDDHDAPAEDAEWAFDRWERSRRIVDGDAEDPPEWSGLDGLADRLEEHHAELKE